MVTMRLVVTCMSIACAISSAVAAPRAAARDKLVEAQQLAATDDNEKALVIVDAGLAVAPKDLGLLQLRGVLLLKTRDYTGAVVAYQAYLDAGAVGAGKREALKIVNSLRAVKSTSIELTANTDATIYLDTKTTGAFCTAPCKKALLPGDYKLIAERAGFDRYVGRISIPIDKTTPLAITLQEKPSPITFEISPAGAQIAIDGKPHEGAQVAAGDHELVVTLPGHATHKQPLPAHEGKPIDVKLAMVPLFPLAVAPATATVTVDGNPAVIEQGNLALAPGPHALVASAPGHHDLSLEIPAARSSTYKVELALRALGTLVSLEGAPAGAKVLIDGKQVATAPLSQPFEVAPGTHRVEVTSSGYRPYSTSGRFVADQHARLAIGKLRRDDRRRTMIAGAATGVVLLGGVGMSVLALGKESDYDARARLAGITPDDPELSSMRSSGKRFSLFADLGFGLAIAGLGVTTYLFLHEGRGESEGSLRIGVGPGGATASLKF